MYRLDRNGLKGLAVTADVVSTNHCLNKLHSNKVSTNHCLNKLHSNKVYKEVNHH